MIKKLLNWQLSLSEKGRPLEKMRPLFTALDTFFYEVPIRTRIGPHIRDSVDLKRWMMLVVFALLPCTLIAFLNNGVQKLVYTSGSAEMMDQYIAASQSVLGYFQFVFQKEWIGTIILYGLQATIPILIISYAVGGFWEALFAVVRRHEISEGFLVTGILYAFILPSTLPYWMVAVGVSIGIILSKELFGGTGMNILNPALVCRCFLFFAYPAYMSGNVWAGTDPTVVKKSLIQMNLEASRKPYDSYSQASPLTRINISPDIKRIHVEAIGDHLGQRVSLKPVLQKRIAKWKQLHGEPNAKLSENQLQSFVTDPFEKGGLNLSPELFAGAYDYAKVHFGLGQFSNISFLIGNRLGCIGETSVIACIIGALVIAICGIGSWRSMLGMLVGAVACALLFQAGSRYLGTEAGAWNPARFDFPFYKHLILGGFAFALAFMITDPVSAPDMKGSMWCYGILVGALTIVIRTINPAFPEGVMLAILFGNVFGPLMDHYALISMRKKRNERTKRAS